MLLTSHMVSADSHLYRPSLVQFKDNAVSGTPLDRVLAVPYPFNHANLRVRVRGVRPRVGADPKNHGGPDRAVPEVRSNLGTPPDQRRHQLHPERWRLVFRPLRFAQGAGQKNRGRERPGGAGNGRGQHLDRKQAFGRKGRDTGSGPDGAFKGFHPRLSRDAAVRFELTLRRPGAGPGCRSFRGCARCERTRGR